MISCCLLSCYMKFIIKSQRNMIFVFSDIFYENYVIEVLYCMKLSQLLTMLYEYAHRVI